MIVVSVSLHSAVTGETTELARMECANDGTGTSARGSYDGKVLMGRCRAALNMGRVLKLGRVENYPRERLHIWNLVARMLSQMGYG